jgi:hypothetical protein
MNDPVSSYHAFPHSTIFSATVIMTTAPACGRSPGLKVVVSMVMRTYNWVTITRDTILGVGSVFSLDSESASPGLLQLNSSESIVSVDLCASCSNAVAIGGRSHLLSTSRDEPSKAIGSCRLLDPRMKDFAGKRINPAYLPGFDCSVKDHGHQKPLLPTASGEAKLGQLLILMGTSRVRKKSSIGMLVERKDFGRFEGFILVDGTPQPSAFGARRATASR